MTNMNEHVLKSLKARNEFIGHLKEDIKKNNEVLEDTKHQLHKLQETIDNVTSLGKYPEHSALIPLAKNIYVKGRIVHTGEYYIRKTASPESYIVLKSLEQTLNSLENDVKLKEKDIERAEYAKFQLEERIKLLIGEPGEFSENTELPEEIISEKGVAVRVGEFYEILEFETD